MVVRPVVLDERRDRRDVAGVHGRHAGGSADGGGLVVQVQHSEGRRRPGGRGFSQNRARSHLATCDKQRGKSQPQKFEHLGGNTTGVRSARSLNAAVVDQTHSVDSLPSAAFQKTAAVTLARLIHNAGIGLISFVSFWFV